MGIRQKIKRLWMTGALIAGFSASSAFAAPSVVLEAGGTAGSFLTNTGSNSGNSAGEGNFSATSSTNVLFVQGNNSSYFPSYVTGINSNGTGDSSDFLQVSGFTPISDDELYALAVEYNGSAPSPTILTDIINDINSANNATFYGAPGSQLASTIPTMLAGDFPAAQGYDVLLTFPSSYTSGLTAGSPAEVDFGFDFTNFGDAAITEPVTVADIGVIPEPASTALLLVLVIPALMSRRRSAN